MCELLVIAKNNDRKGEVVVIEDDDFPWSKLEGPPDFVIIKRPGELKEKYDYLLEKDLELDASGKQVEVGRRKVRVQDVVGAEAAKDDTEFRTKTGAYPRGAGTREGRGIPYLPKPRVLPGLPQGRDPRLNGR